MKDFLFGADIVVEEIEGYFLRIRALLYAAARAKGLYTVRSNAFGFCNPLWVFVPDGMTFHKFLDLANPEDISPDLASVEGLNVEKFLFGKRSPNGYPEELIQKLAKDERKKMEFLSLFHWRGPFAVHKKRF